MEGLTNKIRTILRRLNISEPPVPVSKVAKLFSIKVVPYPKFPDKRSGFITEIEGSLVIGVNSNHSEVRQRFTISHELGHFLLGHQIDTPNFREEDSRPIDQEREADNFAAELLIPRDFLSADIKANRMLKIPELARRYNVSGQAMSIRLLQTGLIKDLTS